MSKREVGGISFKIKKKKDFKKFKKISPQRSTVMQKKNTREF